MNVEDLMSRSPKTCAPTDTLHRAAEIMWQHDCGSVPVVDAEGRLVGIVTDRDACMSSFTRGRPFHEIGVEAAMSKDVFTLQPTTPVARALELFAEKRVRRFPVVSARGALVGILSIADVARAASRPGSARALKPELALTAFEAVSSPRPRDPEAPLPNAKQAASAATLVPPAKAARKSRR